VVCGITEKEYPVPGSYAHDMKPFTRAELIGMVHLKPLPGSPKSEWSVDRLASHAAAEAKLIAASGFGGIIVENMHDAPYVNAPHAPETVAAMTVCVKAVRDAVPNVPVGVQLLSFGHREALAIAHATGASFIRVENFVYAHVADEGLMHEACAGSLLRARRNLGAMHVRIFCDIKKKHASHAITADLTIADFAHGAEFFGADGLIVTGAFTGSPTSPSDLESVRSASKLPILVGSGVTPDQLPSLMKLADGLIVGSFIKHGGVWSIDVDESRCRALAEARRAAL
jgi:membrane complex biogenesis BtpA family protein